MGRWWTTPCRSAVRFSIRASISCRSRRNFLTSTRACRTYKAQVQAEIEQEAADAGMTVEEYAAAGYEAPATRAGAPRTGAAPGRKPRTADKRACGVRLLLFHQRGRGPPSKGNEQFSDYKPGSATRRSTGIMWIKPLKSRRHRKAR